MSRAIVALLMGLLMSGCRNIEVEKVLRITDVRTGWYDAGLVAGQKNKLVPSISLRLENISAEPVNSVQLNAIFRRVGEQQEWGAHYVMAIPREGLAPGAKTNPIVLRSEGGYTGTQSRLNMLQNREFVDAQVQIFGRRGSSDWVRLLDQQIERELLTE
jgi:hypothetical protein